MTGLIEAVNQENAPPCEVFNCAHVKTCAKNNVSCAAFNWYVKTGFVLEPGGVYDKLKGAWVVYPFVPNKRYYDEMLGIS